MDNTTIFILVAILALAAVGLVLFLMGEGAFHQRLTPLAAIAFVLIIAGIVFASNPAVGYVLIGAGAAAATGDVFYRRRRA